MATLCKLYSDAEQIIVPETWTPLRFERALRDDGPMWGGGGVSSPDSALITPRRDGDFEWERFVHWESIIVPEGDTRPRQFLEQFCRDPYTAPDTTATTDGVDTPGKEFRLASWRFRGRAGQPVAVRVWHDHHEPVKVTHSQFIASTSDY
ncbi:hypothetical protein [Streptomyces chumphonensis]|uniref:hypothetical protein n=1 Tax=Streptomyces chumphonensis TaxID=1214925 RepID=UPI003D71590E